MRQHYTPIFRSTLTSRVWALPASARCVWLWLQLMADPEGYVPTDIAGVAIGARVTGDEAREALQLLALADADADPEDLYEGRLIERVSRGWRVLGFEEVRALAKLEAKNARNRKYMAKRRAANDTEPEPREPQAADVDAVDSEGRLVGSPKPKPKPTPKPKTIVAEAATTTPLPPGGSVAVALSTLPEDWTPSEELRADAAIAGVSKLDERIASLRTGPIGGARGVLPDQLENYIRAQLGKWRLWEEADRAKARADERRAAQVASGRKPWEEPEPLIDLDVRYLDTSIRKYIEHHAMGDYQTLIAEWRLEAEKAGKKLPRGDVDKAIKAWLVQRRKGVAA